MSQSLFDKVVGFQNCDFIKKRLQHRYFSCEYCEIVKNTYFEKHLWTTASGNSWAIVFQESLALPFKRNALTSGICNLGELVLRTQVQTGSQGFYLPYIPDKFSKFRPEKTYFVFSEKSSEFLFFLILFSAGIYLLKVWLKGSQNGYIFFSFSILKWHIHITVQTNRNDKLFFKDEHTYK